MRLHVDDFIYSHVNPKVTNKIKEWMNCNYARYGEVKSNIGKVHEYLGMNLYFIGKEKARRNMDDYVERMINDFPMKISKSCMALSTAENNIFEKGNRRSMGKKVN